MSRSTNTNQYHLQPPKLRTPPGAAFSTVNLSGVLKIQHCDVCQTINYPPREVCRNCLSEKLFWRETSSRGEILGVSELFYSQSAFFKVRIKNQPWPIASVSLAGQVLFTHLAVTSFADIDESKSLAESLPGGTPVNVFSASDASDNCVLFACAIEVELNDIARRRAIARQVINQRANNEQ